MANVVRIGHIVDGKAVEVTPCAECTASEGFTWIHAVVPSDDQIYPWLHECIEVFDLTHEDVRSEHMRTGIEQHGEGLALMIMSVQNGGDQRYTPVGLQIEPKRLITTCPREVPTITEIFDGWLRDTDDIGRDIATVLHSVMDALLDDFFPVLDQVHDKIDDVEALIFENHTIQTTEFVQLKRELLVMRKQVSPTRDGLNALVRFGAPMIPQSKVLDFMDLHNHTMRLIENIDLGRDILSGLVDAHLGVISMRLNEVMKTLTVISTLLMVCSLIAGIYGMNFKHMPELDWRYGYGFSIGLMVLASVVVVKIFRSRKWL
jgi:magnesium transporter